MNVGPSGDTVKQQIYVVKLEREFKSMRMLDTLINNCSDFKKCDFRNMPRMNATIAKKPVKSL